MTNQILFGMACEYTRKLEPCSDLSGFDQTSAMKAALLWLADNVSDEMVYALRASLDRSPPDTFFPSIGYAKAIAAALRAAAGGGEK